MREFLLKKLKIDGDDSFVIIDPVDKMTQYSLIKGKESLLKNHFTVQSKTDGEVAVIKSEHILFTPAKLPKLTVSTENGKRFIISKELEQLCDTVNVEGEGLSIQGTVFSDTFELLHRSTCIAKFNYKGTNKSILIDESYELIAVSFAFAMELVK